MRTLRTTLVLVMWAGLSSTLYSCSLTDDSSTPPPEGPASGPPGAVRAADSAPISFVGSAAAENLFAERLADQVDLRRQEERVNEVRFKIRSQVNIDGPLIFNSTRQPRESWAVPLAIVEHQGQEMLAVGTTRCVVDYSYPFTQLEGDRRNFRNLALFSGEGRREEVFRVVEPANLVGSQMWDGEEGILGRNREMRQRYRRVLGPDPSIGVRAELVEGEWATNAGVDFVILYFPTSDPGVRALDPRPARTLQMREPMERMREALGGRTSLWGDTFTFSLVSAECMQDVTQQIAQNNADARRMKLFAVATAIVLIGVISGGAATPAFAQLSQSVGTALARRSAVAAVGPVWRTLVRTVGPRSFQGLSWSDGGRMVLRFLRPERGMTETTIAGISNEGLSPDRAASVLGAIQALLQAGDLQVPTVLRDGAEYGSLMQADRRLDVAAELLRQGAVRLDTSDTTLLQQQPTLVRAARDALVDHGQSGTIADPAYQASVRNLVASLGL